MEVGRIAHVCSSVKRTAPLQWAMHPHAGLGRIFFSRRWFAYSLKNAVPAMKLWDYELFAPLIGMADLLKRGIAPMIKQCTSPPFTLVHHHGQNGRHGGAAAGLHGLLRLHLRA